MFNKVLTYLLTTLLQDIQPRPLLDEILGLNNKFTRSIVGLRTGLVDLARSEHTLCTYIRAHGGLKNLFHPLRTIFSFYPAAFYGYYSHCRYYFGRVVEMSRAGTHEHSTV